MGLRVGPMGCGGVSRFHARAYANHPRMELVACADPVEGKAASLADAGYDGAVHCEHSTAHEYEAAWAAGFMRALFDVVGVGSRPVRGTQETVQ